MKQVFQILVSARCRRLALATGVVGALAACGQKGPLYLPTGEAAAGRATLPQVLTATPSSPASSAPRGEAPSPTPGR